MSDPFFLPPRSVASISGGRTSGYMLWRILQAHGGDWPADRVAVFCNTGLELEETYRFVEDLNTYWNVPIRWLEYRWEPGRHSFVEVMNFPQASRNGEPFRMAIKARGFLPNPVTRFCTAELKIRTTNRFVRQGLGWKSYGNAIGLRADEPKRVAKMRRKRTVTVEPTLFGDERRVERGADHPPGELPLLPLADAGVTNEDVLAFWRSQPFDLRLPVDERTGKTLGGNCSLCFLKGTGAIVNLIRQRPELADWWVEAETLIQGREQSETERFRSDRPGGYAELRRIALGLVEGPGWLHLDNGGMACGDVTECNCTD